MELYFLSNLIRSPRVPSSAVLDYHNQLKESELSTISRCTYIQTACLISGTALSVFTLFISDPTLSFHFSLASRGIAVIDSLSAFGETLMGGDGLGAQALKITKLALSILGIVAVFQGLTQIILATLAVELVIQLFQICKKAYEGNEKDVLFGSLKLIGVVLGLAARIAGGAMPLVLVLSYFGLFNGIAFYLQDIKDFKGSQFQYKANRLCYFASMLVSFASISGALSNRP